jgi:hypothetical protein
LLVSRKLSKGSRLLVVVDVNKGPWAQVNYGTGKDVSDESIADAKEPFGRRNGDHMTVPNGKSIAQVPERKLRAPACRPF